MATVGQNLKASIQIGGNIDPSWKGSVSEIKDGLRSVNGATKKLTTQQGRLVEKIKQAKLAGKDVSGLVKDYEKLSGKIKRSAEEQEELNKALERAERLERWRGRGASALKGAGNMIKGAGLLGAAGAGIIIVKNAETAEQAGIARSYGVEHSTYAAWDSLGKQMGLNGENIGDLHEEYRNRVFDYEISDRKSGAIKEVFPKLDIKEGEFVGKTNEEQVAALFEKLLKVRDEQMAAGMADSLFGGEANKILTYMRLTGKNYQQLMDEQRRYNLVTKEGAAGAVAGNIALSNFKTVLNSGAAEISGLLGQELAPVVQDVTKDLAEWFKNGGVTSIKGFIRDDVIPGAIAFGQGLWTIARVTYELAKKLSWLLPDEAKETEQKSQILAGVASGNMSPELAKSHARQLGLGEWYDKAVNTPDKVKLLREQWKQDHQPGVKTDIATVQKNLLSIADPTSQTESFTAQIAALGEKLNNAPSLEPKKSSYSPQGNPYDLSILKNVPGTRSAKGDIKNTYSIKADFNITQNEGEDGLQLAERVTKDFDKITFDAGRGSMTDGYNPWEN